ncbi:MAG TPA: cell division protein FtsL [Candidatus Fimimorpha excrementavium]|nr:cell division protein FtsL [Candidatus Fimimorpha excrementavium]
MAQRKGRQTPYGRTPSTGRYVEDNVVRRMEIDVPIPEEFEERRRRARRRRAIRERTQQNREKGRQYTLIQMGALAIAVVGVLGFGVRYLKAHDEMNTYIQNIARLEEEYSNKVSENDGLSARIESEIDYNEIYRIATEELGMSYPQKHQEIEYDHVESEYVRQYDDIPNE